jgi:hypothetical protein
VSIAGLTGSCTPLADFSEPTGTLGLSSFNHDTGALVMDVLKDSKAGCTYDASFKLMHSATSSAGVVPKVLVTGTPVEDQGTTGLAMTVPSKAEEKPMKIDAPVMTMYKIWQNSSLPSTPTPLP